MDLYFFTKTKLSPFIENCKRVNPEIKKSCKWLLLGRLKGLLISNILNNFPFYDVE